MSEDIKLFVSCHKLDTHIPDNALLQPIQVGAALAASRMPNLLHDDEGDSISEKNRSYCELTGQCWAWQNTRRGLLRLPALPQVLSTSPNQNIRFITSRSFSVM